MEQKKKIKVLVVDDSSMVRQIFAQGLGLDPGIEVVGTAADPYMARDMIIEHRPDVLTLDVEMPRMDGVEFLQKLMPQYPIPTVMVSSLTQKGKKITLDALEAGAIDFISKPTSNMENGLNSMLVELRTKIKIASTANVSHWKNKRPPRAKQKETCALSETTHKVVAIGASTGGTEALRRVINDLPASFPGVVVVQHMPPGFTKLYAEGLNNTAMMQVVEGSTGEKVVPGKVIIAPGGMQMVIKRVGGIYQVECYEGDKVNGHCPSVEVLFKSVATQVGGNAVGVILTGMGGDGGMGMLEMKKNGAYNMAQDKDSCVVFGMPKVAIEMGGVDAVLPLDDIAGKLINIMREKTWPIR